MNDQQKVQLLPCPFCGGTPKVRRQGNDHTRSRKMIIHCPDCRVQITNAAIRHGFAWLEEVTFKAWNTRQAAVAHASSAAVKESLTAHSSSDFDELHDLAKWFRERGDELNSAWLEKIAQQYVAPATCKEVLQVGASAEDATTNPQESSSRLVDARDAERYRYVRSSCGEFVQYAGCGTHHLLEDEELDQAIDQAIAGNRGDGHG